MRSFKVKEKSISIVCEQKLICFQNLIEIIEHFVSRFFEIQTLVDNCQSNVQITDPALNIHQYSEEGKSQQRNSFVLSPGKPHTCQKTY